MPACEPRVAIVGGAGELATQALAWILTESGAQVVGTYASFSELSAPTAADTADLAAMIVDADDPQAGPGAVGAIRRSHPEVKLLMLCGDASPAVIRCAIEHGVEGVVLKSDSASEVIVGLRHVLAGRTVLPAQWHEASLEPEVDPALAVLSAREREVLRLASQGLSNEEIAGQLVISANTVKFHLRAIYARLGVHNRVQATQLFTLRHEDTRAGAKSSATADAAEPRMPPNPS